MNAVVPPQDQFPTAAVPQQLQPQSAAEASYSLLRRKAVDFSKSTLVPKEYQGNPANVMIAMEIAQRIGASDLMVMQNLYIVHGRPSWSATFLIASVNASKRFTPLRFEVVGTDPAKKDYKVRAYAKDLKTDELCLGAWITWAMVDGEKWGAKWKTMPEQMFMYRAASFWTRTYASEVAMGIHTTEEVIDVWGDDSRATTGGGSIKQLESELLGKPITDAEMDGEPDLLTVERVIDGFADCDDTEQLDDAYEVVRMFEDIADRDRITAAYDTRRTELEA